VRFSEALRTLRMEAIREVQTRVRAGGQPDHANDAAPRDATRQRDGASAE